MLDFDKLQKVKLEIKNESASFLPAYQKLMADAKNALDAKPTSVVEKNRTAASGDKHDYLSLAPYWWPDPDKEDGLPWIRRDGEVNPMTRGKM